MKFFWLRLLICRVVCDVSGCVVGRVVMSGRCYRGCDVRVGLCIGSSSSFMLICLLCSVVFCLLVVSLCRFILIVGYSFWKCCMIFGRFLNVSLLMKFMVSCFILFCVVWCVCFIVCVVCVRVVCVLIRNFLFVGVSCMCWVVWVMSCMFIFFLRLWIELFSVCCIIKMCLVVCLKCFFLVRVMKWCRCCSFIVL